METVTTETKYLTTNELSELKKIGEKSQELVIKFGQNEYQAQILKSQKNELIKEFENLKEFEQNLLINLESKYGKININLETGEITPIS